jgi:small subunit ribosomal protein S6
MRYYETIFIVQPDLAGDAYTEVVEKFKGILTDLGASIIAVEEWGNRKLAYLVKKQKRGSYVLLAFEGKPEGIRELERRMRIDDKVIKFLTVQPEGGYKPSSFVSVATEESYRGADAGQERDTEGSDKTEDEEE